MTKQEIAERVTVLRAECTGLLNEGAAQFDGSEAWNLFTHDLGEDAVKMAKELQECGDVGPAELSDHLGKGRPG
jgi:hypothetical protein